MQLSETKGLILFSRDHKEKDKLVKIFTESAGKQMFYVKGAHKKNNPLTPALMNFTEAVYFGTIRSEGLSFLNGAKEVQPFHKIQEDIFLAGYATYMLNLVDAAIEDRLYDPHLFHFTEQGLIQINEGADPEIICNIFEVQLLNRFGISPIWDQCAICGETTGKFDYSSKYNGVLCERHWGNDPHRYHADARGIHFLRLFAKISYDQIQSIQVKPETKQAIRKILDELYEEYVGLHLKSKKFIDQMHDWEKMLKPPEEKL
ncbi:MULTISPECIES: DNA repair protein RecO [Enterococcus]|uniref:DNA repair protein RecO n=1 Tax=Enterococcus TaxID=1350 RepID=UPI00065E4EA7|nr:MULTISPECIES: DNA repair protein RecO [Enterococcus]KAF1304890.1 DNA repair protein RecO [Enterococcus sp. JM9B]